MSFAIVFHIVNSTSFHSMTKNPIMTLYNPTQHALGNCCHRIYSSVCIDKFDLRIHFTFIFMSYDITFSVHIHNSQNNFDSGFFSFYEDSFQTIQVHFYNQSLLIFLAYAFAIVVMCERTNQRLNSYLNFFDFFPTGNPLSWVFFFPD